jgi:hypothetical protein
MDDNRELIDKLTRGDGAVEQAEQWLAQLQEQDPYFRSSDRMLHLEAVVLARRALVDLEKQYKTEGSQLSKADLIRLVEEIIQADGTEAEIDARIKLLRKNMVFPRVTDLIYYHEPELTAEEVIEKALAYKPIQLPGPTD